MAWRGRLGREGGREFGEGGGERQGVAGRGGERGRVGRERWSGE